MARGWESKSVELQMEDAGSVPDRLHNAHEDAPREREREVLRLARTRLLSEIESTTNPRLIALKRRALEHVDQTLAGLG